MQPGHKYIDPDDPLTYWLRLGDPDNDPAGLTFKNFIEIYIYSYRVYSMQGLGVCMFSIDAQIHRMGNTSIMRPILSNRTVTIVLFVTAILESIINPDFRA